MIMSLVEFRSWMCLCEFSLLVTVTLILILCVGHTHDVIASLGKLSLSLHIAVGTVLSVALILVSGYCHDIICFEIIYVG